MESRGYQIVRRSDCILAFSAVLLTGSLLIVTIEVNRILAVLAGLGFAVALWFLVTTLLDRPRIPLTRPHVFVCRGELEEAEPYDTTLPLTKDSHFEE